MVDQVFSRVHECDGITYDSDTREMVYRFDVSICVEEKEKGKEREKEKNKRKKYYQREIYRWIRLLEMLLYNTCNRFIKSMMCVPRVLSRSYIIISAATSV